MRRFKKLPVYQLSNDPSIPMGSLPEPGAIHHQKTILMDHPETTQGTSNMPSSPGNLTSDAGRPERKASLGFKGGERSDEAPAERVAGKRAWLPNRDESDDDMNEFYETETIDGCVYRTKIRVVSPACLKEWKTKVKETLNERDALQEKLQEISLEFCEWKEHNTASSASGAAQSTLDAIAELNLLLEASIDDHNKAENALQQQLETERSNKITAEREAAELAALLEQSQSDKNKESLELQEEITRLGQLIAAAEDRDTHYQKMHEEFEVAKSEISRLSGALDTEKDAASSAEVAANNAESKLETVAQEHLVTIAKMNKLQEEMLRLRRETEISVTTAHESKQTIKELRQNVERLSAALALQKLEATKAQEDTRRGLESATSKNSEALREKEAKINSLESQISHLIEEKDRISQTLVEAERLASESSNQVSDLEEANEKIVLHHRVEIQRLQQLHDEEMASVTEEKSALEELRRAEDVEANLILQNNQAELSRLRSALSAAEAVGQSLRLQIDELGQALEASKQAVEISQDESNTKISSLQADKATMESQLEQIREANIAYETNITSLHRRVSDLQTEAQERNQAISFRDEVIVQLRTELATMMGNSLVLPGPRSSTISSDAESLNYQHEPSGPPSHIALGKRRELTSTFPVTDALAGTARKFRAAPTPDSAPHGSRLPALTPSQTNAIGTPERAFNARGGLFGHLVGASQGAGPSSNRITAGQTTSQVVASAQFLSGRGPLQLSQNHRSDTTQPTPGPSALARASVTVASHGSSSNLGQTLPAPPHLRHHTNGTASTPDPHNTSFGTTVEANVPIGNLQSPVSDAVAQNLFQGMENITKVVSDLREDVKNQGARNNRTRSKHIASPFKPQALRKPRTQSHTNLMRDVRKAMNQMLEIRKDEDIVESLSKGHFISEHDASLLQEADLDDGVIRSNLTFLKPCWDVVKCRYNATLGLLFTAHFIERHPAYSDLQSDVASHFAQRLGSLKTVISRHLPRGSETQEAANERHRIALEKERHDKRIRQRQWEGFYRRTDDLNALARIDPAYKPILDAITTLGVDGYSSDETTTGGYLVKEMAWRSRKLDNLVEIADGAHKTVNANGNRLTGGQMRDRIRPPYRPISTTPAPTGLPINYYDEVWYGNLTVANQHLLRAGPCVPFPGDGWDLMDEA